MILKENQVVCKKCSKVLTVANPKGLRSAYCICGICHSRIEVNFWVEDRNADTMLGTVDKRGNDMITALPASSEESDHAAFLLVEGKEYALKNGNNTVGRWSPSSQADVQLPVMDSYLSRLQLLVNVYRLPDGKLRITVKNLKNKNETMVNGKPLGQDTLVVSEGDIISMGDTTAKVIIKPET